MVRRKGKEGQGEGAKERETSAEWTCYMLSIFYVLEVAKEVVKKEAQVREFFLKIKHISAKCR